MLKKTVIEFFGNQLKTAKALKLSKSYVCQWGLVIPEVQALRIEKLTNGALKYDPALYTKPA
ncbi:Cro/CI family transcriptional regulator [Marinomonas primoryensis]|uniref:Cro/CI family transcriptional regulator n=1 Tax=Marinomonas primoryensis TaxID=178399 RepID=A0ABV0KX63_9GAMM